MALVSLGPAGSLVGAEGGPSGPPSRQRTG